MRGGCQPTCRLGWRSPKAAVDLPAALPWMQGGGRTICDIEAEVDLPAALPWM